MHVNLDDSEALAFQSRHSESMWSLSLFTILVLSARYSIRSRPAPSTFISSGTHNTHESNRKLLLDLKSDIHDFRAHVTLRLNEVQDDIRKLHHHFTGKLDEASLEAATSASTDLEVPHYLQVKFEAAIRAVDPELQDDIKFPLAKGIDAFHHHFEQVWHGGPKQDRFDS